MLREGSKPTAESLIWASTLGELTPLQYQARGPSLERGAVLGTYRIGRLLGEGGMGCVYAARDTMLGRLVALKVLRPDRLDPSRVERFEAEGRLTAQFSHPNIVQVYGLGYSDGTPYLALEYLDGETLGRRLSGEAIGPLAMARLLKPVAEAVAEAHSRGILHRDLKPNNIMLAHDGRVRVLDFGLAALFEELVEGPRIAGTPTYMAPEQWLGGKIGPAADVWALGVMIHEGLFGHRPYGPFEPDMGQLRAQVTADAPTPIALPYEGLDDRIYQLMASCLDKSPAARPNAATVAATLAALLSQRERATEAPPYPGLRPFREEDAGNFFGREAEVARAQALLRTAGMLVVLGPSGSGKSSLVLAGLLPRLREAGRWTVIRLRPAGAPFERLAETLRTVDSRSYATLEADWVVPDTGDQITGEWLREKPERAALLLHTLAARSRGRVLLIVDQAEELVTHGVDHTERRAFLRMLRAVGADLADPVRVVMTVRDDYLGRLMQGADSAESREALLPLGPLGRAQLRAAIEGPLTARGFRFERPTVVGEMVLSVAGDVAGLPVLQFVCARLWEERDDVSRVIPHDAYLAIGGVSGAIARHADETLAAMGPSVRNAARPVLLRLVTGEGTRRSLERRELLEDLPAEAADALDKLVEARLVTSRGDEAGAGNYDLAHESLVSHWRTLRRWLEEVSEDLAALREVEEAARQWDRRGRPDNALWRGEELETTIRSVERLDDKGPQIVRIFLETARDRQQTRKRRRRLLATVSLALLVVLALGSTMAAMAFARAEAEVRREKERGEQQAEQMRLAAADIGVFVLELSAFDWDAGSMAPRPAPDASIAGWTLHEPDSQEPRDPAEEVPADRMTRASVGGHRYRIETRSGPAWLRVARQWPDGRPCPPSWVPMRWLPGYADRRDDEPTTLLVQVPSCQATMSTMVEIEAGPYISQGPGVPATRFPAYVDPEREIWLPAFYLGRTEVPNALYAQFGAMTDLTGRPVPQYPSRGFLSHGARPNHPVANIDWWGARDFCRYLGGRLPTSQEWEKAARGGLTIGGRPNPWVRRNLPWGGTEDGTSRAHLKSIAGPHPSVPVDAHPDSDSPYGLRQMAGNVAEWTSSLPDSGLAHFRVLRGGGFDDPVEEQMHWIVYENMRDARYLGFDIGVRCAVDPMDTL